MFEITGFEDNLDIFMVTGDPAERAQDWQTEEEEGGAEEERGGLEAVGRGWDDEGQDWEGEEAGEEEVESGHLDWETGVWRAGGDDGEVGEEGRED